jgi:ABC-type thiamine transport system substrate-binding protein
MNPIRKLTAALAVGAALALPAMAQDKVTIYTAAPQDLLDQIIPAFEKSAKVKVDVIKGGSGDLINRLKAEAGRSTADVLFSVSTDVVEANAKLFTRFTPDNAKALVRQLQDQRCRGAVHRGGHVHRRQHQAADAGAVPQDLDRPGQPDVQGQDLRRPP